MPTYDELKDAFDKAWRTHDYEFALTCISEMLTRFRDSKNQLWQIRDFVVAPVYSNLAAAFEADDVLKMMDRVSKRILAKEGKGTRSIELADERRSTVLAMRWLRHQVELSARIELKALISLAETDNIGKVKSRLTSMERAGSVHLIGSTVHAGPARDRQFLPMGNEIGGVPVLRPYMNTESEMDDTQRLFYSRFETRFRAGEHVELENQWSYAFVLRNKLEAEHDGDALATRALYAQFEEEYPDSPLTGYVQSIDADRHFELGEWQSGFDLLLPYISLDVYLTLASVVRDSRLHSATVSHWTSSGRKTTRASKPLLEKIDIALQDLLDASHEELGRSVIVDLWHRLIVDREPGALGPSIADEFGGFITQPEIDEFLGHHDRMVSTAVSPEMEKLEREHGIFEAMEAIRNAPEEPPEPGEISWPVPYCNSYWFEQIARARIQSLYRDAENIVRTGAGMPRVGEGWISEVLLLQSVREAFPELHVQHQGRPAWLGQQSLDVYLPDQNIAIEYQGAQHSGPVARWGGLPGYERQLERDARKRRLCLENGCALIEVFPGYEIESVLESIRGAIRR